MTPHELTTLLAEPTNRQFDEPYKLMLLDRCFVWYDRLVRNTLERDPRRRKEFLRYVDLTLNDKKESPEVPAFLFVNGINFDYVGGTDGSSPFIYVSGKAQANIFQHNKYGHNTKYYSFLNRSVQVYCTGMQQFVRLEGVFLNPKVVAETSGVDMYEFMNTDMQIPGDIMQLIILSMSQNDLQSNGTNKDEVEVRDVD